MATTFETNIPARLDLKTNQMLKSQLEEAAKLSGVNLTAFILSAASEKAREVVRFHSSTTLSSKGWMRLNDIIDNPPPTKPALKALMQSRRTKSGDTI